MEKNKQFCRSFLLLSFFYLNGLSNTTGWLIKILILPLQIFEISYDEIYIYFKDIIKRR